MVKPGGVAQEEERSDPAFGWGASDGEGEGLGMPPLYPSKKKLQKEVDKLRNQVGKSNSKVQALKQKLNDHKQEEHHGKGGGKGKDGGKGGPTNTDTQTETVDGKLQNDVDNKDLQRQKQDYIDYAVIAIGFCIVGLYVYYASKS